MPVDFLLGIDAADDVLVGLHHGRDVRSIELDVSVNEHQVRTVRLEKPVNQCIPRPGNQAFIEHERHDAFVARILEQVVELDQGLAIEASALTTVHRSR